MPKTEDKQAVANAAPNRADLNGSELKRSRKELEQALSLLEATLEATADGIFVVDLEGRIIAYNKRFAEMWRVPQRVLDARDDAAAIAFVLEQLKDPDGFLAKVRELYAQPEAESYDQLEFKDGRVFARYSKPQRIGGQSVGRVWSFHDVTEQIVSERELQHLAEHDSLTGLANRRRFEHELARELAYSARYGGEPPAALLIDLDNFKYVNDTLGHKLGDELIKSVAALLDQRLRETDVLARIGGDEFAILLPQAGEQGARTVASDLLERVRNHSMAFGGQHVSMSCSIGVAVVDPAADDADQILSDADLAMYEAKEAGKDRVSLYTSARARQAREEVRFTWAERIRRALEEDGFELHQQPILELATGTVSQYELLLRMVEDGQLIPPAAFLPSAERLGLVQRIDRWVVERAIRLIAEQAARGREISVEVNLSGKSIGDEELTRLVGRWLAEHEVDPSRLIFEVTETAAIANMDQAAAFARQLTELGCRFALDDFGTGFGSFYYLKYLPVSYLKIDGDFIANLPDSRTDQLVVRSIVQIARDLGKRTIAEFVGDERTVKLLREYGVDYAQGYHVGRPAPIAELGAGDRPAG